MGGGAQRLPRSVGGLLLDVMIKMNTERKKRDWIR